MKKLSYKRLKNNIPTSIKTSSKDTFEILWSDNLCNASGAKLYGETRFEPNQIVINKEQTDKDAVLTAWHEVIHAVDHSHEIGLTEAQVIKLEKSFQFIREFFLTIEKL